MNHPTILRIFSKLIEQTDDDKRMVLAVLGVALIGNTVLVVANISRSIMLPFDFVLMVAALLALRGILLPARWLTPLVGLGAFGILIFINKGVRDTAVLGTVVIVVAAGLLAGRWGTVTFGGLAMLVIAVLGIAEANGWIRNSLSGYNQLADYLVVETGILVVTVLQYAVIRRLNENVRKVHQELAERNIAERALRESEALYESLVTVLPLSLCRKDAAGRITFANASYCQEFRRSLDQLIDKTDFDLHPHELAEKYRQDDRFVIETGQAIELVEEHTPIGGTTSYVQVFKTPIRDAFGKIAGVQIMFWDISARKRAEADREALIKELEAKNAELERFTYTVSHDLKSPLITIQGFMGFVEQDASTGNVERLKADLGRIAEATKKMARLLNELLELSRIGRMMNPPEDVPFNMIVHDAIELVRGRLDAKNIHIMVAEGLPVVRVDRVRLAQVVQNLIDNAAKFMGDQKEPRIEIGQRGSDKDGNPVFFVRDNGIGIDPQYKDKVFGLFSKLDAQSEGTGVGLALVKRIVEAHGGKIWLESELGHGASFYFTLLNSLAMSD